MRKKSRKKLRIVNKKKFIRTTSIIICFFIFIIIGASKIYSSSETVYKKSYIYTGDTLWSIAEQEAEENPYYKGKDIRYIIRDIRQINHLDSGEIYDGQELQIPTL